MKPSILLKCLANLCTVCIPVPCSSCQCTNYCSQLQEFLMNWISATLQYSDIQILQGHTQLPMQGTRNNLTQLHSFQRDPGDGKGKGNICTDIGRYRHRHRHRHTGTETETQRQRQRHRDRDTETETETETQRQRHRDRDRDRHRHRHRHRHNRQTPFTPSNSLNNRGLHVLTLNLQYNSR